MYPDRPTFRISKVESYAYKSQSSEPDSAVIYLEFRLEADDKDKDGYSPVNIAEIRLPALVEEKQEVGTYESTEAV
jgi:hypothetical protein